MDVGDLLIRVRCGRPGCGKKSHLAVRHLEVIARDCGIVGVSPDGTKCTAKMATINGWTYGVSLEGCLYGICGEDAAAAEATYQAAGKS